MGFGTYLRRMEMRARQDERRQRQKEAWARRDAEQAEKREARETAVRIAAEEAAEYEALLNAWRRTPPILSRAHHEAAAEPRSPAADEPAPARPTDEAVRAELVAHLLNERRSKRSWLGRVFAGWFGRDQAAAERAAETLLPDWLAARDSRWEIEAARRRRKQDVARRNHEAVEAARVEQVRALLNGDAAACEAAVEAALSAVDFPFDTQAYAMFASAEEVRLLLDLPEIEDVIPEVRTEVSARGELKSKRRSAAERAADYAELVLGLAYAMGAAVLSASPATERVAIAAYTQRRKRGTGEVQDEFVYDVTFDRPGLSAVRFETVNPVADALRFPSRIDVAANGTLRRIDPPGWAAAAHEPPR